jgi:hypothetical protein
VPVTLSGDGSFSTSSFSGGGAAPRTLPTYLIDVAWSRTRTGVVTIGTSTIGGSDQIGGLYSHFTFASIKSDVKDLQIRRGRVGQDGAMNAGTLSVVLDDQTGVYNPENAGSALSPNVVPLRPIRVRATHNSITYGLFFGFITRIEHEPAPSAQQTRIEAVDFFHWLDVFKPVISLPETTVGAAIGALLAACGLSDPNYLALDTGHPLPFLVGNGSASALQLIQELLAVDMGVLFVDGDGKVTYHDTNRRYAPASVDDTLTTALIGDARPATDIAQVRNGWTVTRLDAQGQPAGPPQSAYDGTTRDNAYFGPRDGDPISSKYLMSDTTAGSLAAFKVLLYKDPTNPVRGVRLSNRDDTLIVKQLARDVGDRVALSESLGGTATTGFVEGVAHHVWEAGRFHEVAYTISKRRFDMATIGSSTIGSAVLGY